MSTIDDDLKLTAEDDDDDDLENDLKLTNDDDDDLENDLKLTNDDDDSELTKSDMKHSSKRVKMIFSVMASPNRIEVLRILNSHGPLNYTELKDTAGFRSKKESGKFAYHLRKLARQSLVAKNRSDDRYIITNLGKLVLSLAKQIESRSAIDSGKMYVRTSHDSVEEFNSHKIMQSLVREGNMSTELAIKITEETEDKIYKYPPTYMTGPLIREIVNSVLYEHGYEEYRSKLIRLGMPVNDIKEMVSNLNDIDNGTEGILFNTGQNIFAEYLFTNSLPKDVTDAHLRGDLHITLPGVWSVVPDIIFINIKDLVEHGINLGGKYLDVPRIPTSRQLTDMTSSLSIILSLLLKEASQEIVLDEFVSLFSRHSKSLEELEQKLTYAFATASTTKYNKVSTIISIRLQLGTDTKIINTIINAYKRYTTITPIPKFGLIIDYTKGKITDVSQSLSEIIILGGKVTFTQNNTSSNGVRSITNLKSLSIILQSISLNLPRLALESSKDETYFRARLALLMNTALSAMVLRKKDISDLTRKGLNPILAKNTQYMQQSSISLVLNLVGLREAVFNILEYEMNDAGYDILYKVISTAVSVADKKSKELGEHVAVCMIENESATRFVYLDSEKFGKNSQISSIERDYYTQGVVLQASQVNDYTDQSDIIVNCNRMTELLNGGLEVIMQIERNTKIDEVKKSIEKLTTLVPTFKPLMSIAICGECGYKGEHFKEKCPKCKSSFIV